MVRDGSLGRTVPHPRPRFVGQSQVPQHRTKHSRFLLSRQKTLGRIRVCVKRSVFLLADSLIMDSFILKGDFPMMRNARLAAVA